MECRQFPALAGTGQLPGGVGSGWARGDFLPTGATTQSTISRGGTGAGEGCEDGVAEAHSWLGSPTWVPMNISEKLDRLMATASEYDASDLHLVAGVPPAFRVNGEIIIADEDAMSERQVAEISNSLLNEQQRRKFD